MMKNKIWITVLIIILFLTGCAKESNLINNENATKKISSPKIKNTNSKIEPTAKEEESVDTQENKQEEVESIDILSYLGKEKSEIGKEFGKPTEEDYNEGSYYNLYEKDNLIFFFLEEGEQSKVFAVTYTGDKTVLGINKSMTVDEIIQKLGPPHYIGLDNAESGVYQIVYNMLEYDIEIIYKDSNGNEISFIRIVSNGGLPEEEIDTNNSNQEYLLETKNGIRLINHYYVDDGMGGFIEGFLQNVSGKDLEFVQISYTFFDSNRYMVGSGDDYIGDLPRDATYKFKIQLYEEVYEFQLKEIIGY